MTIEASMENSNGSIVDYSSEIETLNNKKIKKVADGYSSMEEDLDCKVEVVESVYAMSSERSEDEWVKPKNDKPAKVETPDKKHICGRLSVVAIHSPGRQQNGSDGGASSSEASPGGSSPSRSCTQCGATKTPLWRNGPSGPKSLCNACGIRYKKVGGTKRTTSTEAGHESSCTKTKSPKRKAEADPPSEPRSGAAHTHRRSKLVGGRDKREADDNNNTNNANHNHNNNNNSSSSKAHEASSSKEQQHKTSSSSSPGVGSNIPRRVCTRRTTFYTPKWGARSARLRKTEAKDEEEQEGAALLMALACGMVNA